MSIDNFDRIASHVWTSVSYMNKDVEGSSRGVATMWNLFSMKGFEVWNDRNFIITKFQTSIENWGLIYIYIYICF